MPTRGASSRASPGAGPRPEGARRTSRVVARVRPRTVQVHEQWPVGRADGRDEVRTAVSVQIRRRDTASRADVLRSYGRSRVDTSRVDAVGARCPSQIRPSVAVEVRGHRAYRGAVEGEGGDLREAAPGVRSTAGAASAWQYSRSRPRSRPGNDAARAGRRWTPGRWFRRVRGRHRARRERGTRSRAETLTLSHRLRV